ncbi:MAG: hypothetical protein NTX45_23250 [Proteobacteria bacterium]|nr:hypothetical protein [Pseudomonadota bacterium]
MKIVHIETLIHKGSFADSSEWQKIRGQALSAVRSVDWPLGSGTFSIYPESGKKRGQGNGVKPIKNLAIANLLKDGWFSEHPWPVGERIKPGKMDAAYIAESGIVAFEWETGNISSSHRSMNKMALGLLMGATIAGLLVVPSRKLYPYLTDRIGNYDELEPYLPLWRATSCDKGILEIIVIEHDAESRSVPRIPKGTDGRAAV